MSIETPPKIDTRTAADISAALVGTPEKPGLLERYTTHPISAREYGFEPWSEYDTITRKPLGRSAALIGIFARFGEMVIDRLNRAPEKNFLAYLDLLGAAREPPQPARVALTYSLAAGAAIDALVPIGTAVAAPPASGDAVAVVFETERPLVVTSAQLTSLLTIDPVLDSYGDWSDRVATPSAFTVFQGERALEHVLYLGDDELFGFGSIGDVKLDVTLADHSLGDSDRQTQWEYWDGTQPQALTPLLDSTNGLATSGTVSFGALPLLSEAVVASRSSRWLRCVLKTPITQSSFPRNGMVRESQLPKITRLILTARVRRTFADGLLPDLGFVNATPFDATKDGFPFGENPKLHDTVYLASTEAFSKDQRVRGASSSATVSLELQLANSHLIPNATSVRPSSDLALVWELWTGDRWQKLGASNAPAWVSLVELNHDPLVLTDEAGNPVSAILQGTAQLGSRLASLVLPSVGQATDRLSVSINADGRFAAKRNLAVGINVFELQATYEGRSRKSWAVALTSPSPAVQVVVDLPQVPSDGPSVALAPRVTGTDSGQVTKFRITNGSTGASLVGTPGTAMQVALAEGRNDLLVEALASQERRMAATVCTISRHAAPPPLDANGFSDGTFGFTQSGVVRLQLPPASAKTSVNGEENYWLRIRLVRGDYGKEASYVLKDPTDPAAGFNLVPASFRPPIVAGVRIGYEFELRRSPDLCLTFNQLEFTDHAPTAGTGAGPFMPFTAVAESRRPGLYFGFSLPPGREFPNTSISLYARSPEVCYGERALPLEPTTSTRAGAAGETVSHTFTIMNDRENSGDYEVTVLGNRWSTRTVSPVAATAGTEQQVVVDVTIPPGTRSGETDAGFLRIAKSGSSDPAHIAVFTTGVDALPRSSPPETSWQYWNGKDWSTLVVADDSAKLTRSGLIEFLGSADFASRNLFGRNCYWLRTQLDQGAYQGPPRLVGILPNTTTALQATTIVNEVLGSSNGAERQRFQSRQIPILAGQRVEVREPAMPSTEDQEILRKEEGLDAINVVFDPAGRPREIWLRWHEMADFHGSGPRDRHYVIDHLTGEVRFGDGVSGRIPPAGTGNLRLAQYRVGGGIRGNCSAATIAQLKTSVPYVEAVVNQDAAAGGVEPETIDALIERAPRTLRHRDRAVTREDYEDLARAASTKVARSLCVPLRDLAADKLGIKAMPGTVSVIVVPRTSDIKPSPTLELLSRVGDFLESRADATASVAVVGPLYVRIDVELEVAVTTPHAANAVDRAVRDRLAAFLHPLTGGLDGNGWDFGRAPHRSDFFALVESVAGVDHVHYLNITETEDRRGVRETGRFLVFSGRHQISTTFVAS